ncbi:DUF4332 domain-containing protein [Rhodovibrio sodomensis]|uniref:DUF4332 domain-containing protein n=1 Tax=Rhodovibrio sodomensis TaxID=1088 RepID=UPI001906940D|nr:DUF4332 domain-containing protein [Rhodovibrio sodomensis]
MLQYRRLTRDIDDAGHKRHGGLLLLRDLLRRFFGTPDLGKDEAGLTGRDWRKTRRIRRTTRTPEKAATSEPQPAATLGASENAPVGTRTDRSDQTQPATAAQAPSVAAPSQTASGSTQRSGGPSRPSARDAKSRTSAGAASKASRDRKTATSPKPRAAKAANTADAKSEDLTKIKGLGPANAKRLHLIGIHTIAQLARASAPDLHRRLGDAPISQQRLQAWIDEAKRKNTSS